MGTQENKASASRFLEEVMNRGNVSLIDELSGADFVDHSAPPGVPPTNEGFKGFITMFRAAFPDLHYTIEDSIAEGDRVVGILRVGVVGTSEPAMVAEEFVIRDGKIFKLNIFYFDPTRVGNAAKR